MSASQDMSSRNMYSSSEALRNHNNNDPDSSDEDKKPYADVIPTTANSNSSSSAADDDYELKALREASRHYDDNNDDFHPETLPFRPQHDLEKNAAAAAAGVGGGDAVAAVEPGSESEQAPAPSAAAAASPPPNGGLRAWLQVLGTFAMFFNSWGIINAFGVYQTYYETGKLFHSTPSNISWIGSVEGCLLMLVSGAIGPIYDAGYIRTLVATGSFLIVLGQMMLSLCTTYWQVFLAQGVCIGIGTGCLFVTGVAVLSTYFSTRLATATGIAATGSSIGGMLYPIIFDKLLPRIGFAWASRVLGFVALGTLIVANVATKVRVRPASRRKAFDLSAWTELPYLFFNLGTFIGFAGLYVVFFYVQSYAIAKGIMGPGLAFYLLTILNASSTFGRFIPNLVADKIGPLNVITPCIFFTSIITFCLIAADNVASIVVLVVLFGFFSGTFVSLPPTILVHLSMKKRHLIGTRMGMAFSFTSIGLVFGPPVGGAILRSGGLAQQGTSFTFVWVFSGCCLFVAGIFVLMGRVAQAGWKLGVKV